MAHSLTVLDLRDSRKIMKPPNFVQYQDILCDAICTTIMDLKKHNLFTSKIRGIEDRFVLIKLSKHDGKLVCNYKTHTTFDDMFPRNKLWPVYDDNGVTIHVEGQVKFEKHFNYEYSLNKLCTDIVYEIIKDSPPRHEPNMVEVLNDENDPDYAVFLSDSDTDSDNGLRRGAEAHLKDIECRIDTILRTLQ